MLQITDQMTDQELDAYVDQMYETWIQDRYY